MQWLGIFILTILGLIIFSILISSADIKNVMENWNTRRCDVPILFTSFLFKPDYDKRSVAAFSASNFQYCIGRMGKEVAAKGMAPFFTILGEQINVANGIAPILNSMRGMLSTSWMDFSNIFQEKYERMTMIMVSFRNVYQHLRNGMGRIFAVAVAAVYAGLSLTASLSNGVRLSLKVTEIVLGLSALLGPLLLPLTIPAGIALNAAGGGESNIFGTNNSQGFQGSSAHCCDPHAEVRMKDGTYTPLHAIQIHDELFSDTMDSQNIVKGILYVDARGTPLVSIENVLMSDTHRVLYKNTWILAKDHPEKKEPPPGTVLERLICLNTTQHSVPLKTCIVGDWEEVSSEEGRRAWIDFVANELDSPSPKQVPLSVPLLGVDSQIYNLDKKQWIPLWQVQLGDTILSSKIGEKEEYTKVRCIYYGTSFVEKSTNTFISDGVWIQDMNGVWKVQETALPETALPETALPETALPDGSEQKGIFLVSESGTFIVRIHNSLICVRDFTEVGSCNVDKCYSFLSTILEKESGSI